MGAHCKEVTVVLENVVEVAEVEADGRKEYFDLESMTEETARRVMIGLERVPYYGLYKLRLLSIGVPVDQLRAVVKGVFGRCLPRRHA